MTFEVKAEYLVEHLDKTRIDTQELATFLVRKLQVESWPCKECHNESILVNARIQMLPNW